MFAQQKVEASFLPGIISCYFWSLKEAGIFSDETTYSLSKIDRCLPMDSLYALEARESIR